MKDAGSRRDLSPELERTLAASGVGLFVFDAATRTFDLDDTCRRIFDLDPDDALSPHVMLTRIHPDDLERYWSAANDSMGSGAFSCDYRVRHRDGSLRFVSSHGHLLPVPAGAAPRLQGLCIDVTAQHAAQQALEARSAELARSNQELEQFAYVASHDLKAPLRAIDILADWLQEDLAGFEGGEVHQNLGLLKQRTARLHQLLDDLLAYSRAGRKPGDIVTLDTRALVEDLFTLLAPPSGMRLSADPSLPLMRACHAPLEQVLRNLINNAIKHHPTKAGSVNVYARDSADEVLFVVEDDGAGIPPEFADKVFQMFQTLKPRDEVEGSGMGLAIVKRLVESQGGRIWLHGGPGGCGTAFKFTWKKLAPEAGCTTRTGVSDERTGQNRTHLAG